MTNVLSPDVQALLDQIAASVSDVNVAVRLAAGVVAIASRADSQRSKNAERQARYRANKAAKVETVTSDDSNVTTVTSNVTATSENRENPPLSAEKALAVRPVGGGGARSSGPVFSLSLTGSLEASSSGDRELDGPPKENLHKTVCALFAGIFRETRGVPYGGTAADRNQLSGLLKVTKEMGWNSEKVLEELPYLFHAYLSDPDEFLDRQGRSLKNFCTQGYFDKYRAKAHSPPVQRSRRETQMMTTMVNAAQKGPPK